MVTGASTADAAVILIDARKGVLTQTRRHAYIAHLLGVRHIHRRREQDGPRRLRRGGLRANPRATSSRSPAALGIADLRFIPMSALRGDMVVERGANMNWYRGPDAARRRSKQLDAVDEAGALPLRFPVQLVVRPGRGSDFRGYAGRVESGVARSAESEVLALPSGRRTVVKDIVSLGRSLPVAVGRGLGHRGPRRRHRHLARRHARRPGPRAASVPRRSTRASAGCPPSRSTRARSPPRDSCSSTPRAA